MRTQKNQWSAGLCSCCTNFGDCLFAWFLPCIYNCSLFSQANETLWSCLFGGLVPLRTKVRTERNIEVIFSLIIDFKKYIKKSLTLQKGSICKDFFAVGCCTCCAMVQLGTEMKNTIPLIQ